MRNTGLLGWLQRGAACLALAGWVTLPCGATGPPPVITAQPTNTTVPFQGTASFSITASSGTTLSYQWLKNGANVGGATSSSYTIANAQTSDAATYSVKVVNGGGSLTSSNAVLTIISPPTIQPPPLANQTATQGQTVTFAVTAGGTAPFVYQWNFDGSALARATNSSLSLTNVQSSQAGSYTVVVTNLAGSVTSPTAKLTVNSPPAITTQPQSQSAVAPQNITFSTSATGTTPLSYQWYFDGSTLAGAGNNSAVTISVTDMSTAGSYTVVVQNPFGSVTSAVATLSVSVPPTITTQPESQSAAQGDDVTLSVVAAGTAPLSYQWYVNGSKNSSVTGQKGRSSTLTLGSVGTSDAGSYTVVVQNNFGSVTSAVAILSVYIPPTITTQPQNQTIIQGPKQNVSFSVAASGTAPLTYQWYFNNGIVGGPAGQSATLALNNAGLPQAGSYAVVVSNPGGAVTSSVVTLTVIAPPTIQPPPPANQTVTQGQTATFSITVGGTAPFAYQWNFDGSPLTSATNSSLSLTNVQSSQAGSYTVVVTNPAGSATSPMATLTVDVPPTITTQPQNQTIIQGPKQNVSFTVAASGTAPLTYQWYFNNGIVGGPAGQTATLALNNAGTSQAGSYAVVVSNPGGSVTSSVVTLTVITPPTIQPPLPTNQTVTQGQTATFSVIAGGTAPFAYQWNFDGSPLTSATNSSLSLTNVQSSQAGSYTAVVTNPAGSVTSLMATLTVQLPPRIITQPQSQTIVQGPAQNVSFTVVAGGTSPLTYQWYFNSGIVAGPAGQSATLALNNAGTSQAGSYAIVVSNSGGAVTSSVVTLTVITPPTIQPPLPANQTVTQGQVATFSITAGGTPPFAYQWNLNGSPLATETNSSLSLTNVQSSQAGSYTVVVTNPAGSVTSLIATLTVDVPPTITTQPQSQSATAFQNVTFTIAATGTTPLSYQWNFSNLPIPLATNNSLTLTNVQTSAIGNYTAVLSNQWGVVTSGVAVLTVNPIHPIITWTNPATIVYGNTLTSNQLNASASISGTFAYSPTNGSTLYVGSNNLSVVFTPIDSVNYTSATDSVSLVVAPAAMVVSANNAIRAYGQANPIFTGIVTGLTNKDTMTVNYNCTATAFSPVGTYNIIPQAVNSGSLTNYTISYVSGALTITQKIPDVAWSDLGLSVYGAALNSNQLNAIANVPGSFSYNPTNGTILNAGTNSLSVIFTPDDTLNYNSVTATNNLVVSPALITVTASNVTRPYGVANPVFGGNMSGVTNRDSITSTYSCSATTNSPVGTYSILPSLQDPNNRLTNYSVTLVNGLLVIGHPSETIVWSNPTPIIYGTPLSATQLSATVNVPGDYVYTPTNGSLLNTGTNILSVVFTPNDTVNYTGITDAVSLVVVPAVLTVSANDAEKTYGEGNPAFTGQIIGVTNGSSVTTSYSCGAVANSPIGMYPIIPSPVQGTGLTNYAINYVSGSLTVKPAPLTITANNLTKTYNQTVLFSGKEFSSTGLANGDIITNVTLMSLGSVPAAGVAGSPYSITVSSAVGTGLSNYNVAYVSGALNVIQATPEVTWTNSAAIAYGTALTSNQLNASADVPGVFSYNPTNGSVLNTGTNALSVTFIPTDIVDYISLRNTVSVAVNPGILIVSANNATRAFGQMNPVFTGTLSGLTNEDNITATYASDAIATSPTGTYSIVPILADPTDRQTNYTITFIDGTLTVGNSLPVVQSISQNGNAIALTWTAAAAQTYQIQFTPSLGSVSWFNLGGPITATNSSITVLDSMTNAQRFYRVILSP